MKKYYFYNKDSEVCFTEEYFQEFMQQQHLKKLQVIEAVKCDVEGYIYCKRYQEVTEKGYCGKDCSEYTPRNGVSGCCKHRGNLMEKGQTVELTLK